MYAENLEQLVLSGELFRPRSRSPSPTRSASPDWDGDLLGDDEYDAGKAANAQIERMLGGPVDSGDGPGGGIGVGVQGRTGVKGVIRDRDEAAGMARAQRTRDAAELARRMERTALTARTYAEDEAAAKLERAREEGRTLSDDDEDGARRDVWGEPKGRFGHLREVGVGGFVAAVEDERRTWVLVHLYESSLERCYALDDTLSQLARAHTNTKFLRARAAALGFASSGSSSRVRAPPSRRAPRLSTLSEDDEDDPYGPAGSDEDGGGNEDDVDTDVLPTLLAYRDGELVHTWVRVDWEAEAVGGFEELLVRHNIVEPMPALAAKAGRDVFASDEE